MTFPERPPPFTDKDIVPPPSIETVAKSFVFTEVKPTVKLVVGGVAVTTIVPEHEVPVQGVVPTDPHTEQLGSLVMLYPDDIGPVAVKLAHVSCANEPAENITESDKKTDLK